MRFGDWSGRGFGVSLVSLALVSGAAGIARAEVCAVYQPPQVTMMGRAAVTVQTVYRCGDPSNPSSGGLRCEAASDLPDDSSFNLVCDPSSAVGTTGMIDDGGAPGVGSPMPGEARTVDTISGCFRSISSTGRDRCRAKCEARAQMLLHFQNARTQSVWIGQSGFLSRGDRIPTEPAGTCQAMFETLRSHGEFVALTASAENALPDRESNDGNSAYSVPILPETTSGGSKAGGAD
jgi:hypothetical protein